MGKSLTLCLFLAGLTVVGVASIAPPENLPVVPPELFSVGQPWFSRERRVNDDRGHAQQSYPVLASHRNQIYAVWSDDRDNQHRAYFAALKD